MLTVVDDEVQEDAACSLDELAREGARRMLQSALAEEVAADIDRHRAELDERVIGCSFATARPERGK